MSEAYRTIEQCCEICGKPARQLQKAVDDGKLWCMECAMAEWMRENYEDDRPE